MLIVGSGHTTHNLRDWMANRAAQRAAALRAGLRGVAAAPGSSPHDTEALVAYRDAAPDAARAHPTEEHFLPLHVAWGAAGAHARVERIVDRLRGRRAGAGFVAVSTSAQLTLRVNLAALALVGANVGSPGQVTTSPFTRARAPPACGSP